MTIIVALIALSFIILVHETGHYLAARALGIHVKEFAIFMGPKLISWKRRDTLFTIRAIPIGGFVSMEGEDEAADSPRSFSRKPAFQKILTILAGSAANLLFALTVLFFLFLFSGYATDTSTIIPENRPAYEQGLRDGDIIRSINGKRVYDPMDLTVLMYGFQGETVEVVYRRHGQDNTVFITPAREGGTQWLINFTPEGESTTVAQVPADSNAWLAGLRPGDVIRSVNGIPVMSRTDIRRVMNETQGREVKLTLEREGTSIDIALTPVLVERPEFLDLGIAYQTVRIGLLDALEHSVRFSVATIRSIYFSIIWLVSGKASLGDMMGPVGIVNIMGETMRQPTFQLFIMSLLHMMAFISLNLGVVNLVPFPALDGSKVIIYAIEGVRRKPFPVEKTAIISLVGFALLILLLLLTTYHDIVRIIRG